MEYSMKYPLNKRVYDSKAPNPECIVCHKDLAKSKTYWFTWEGLLLNSEDGSEASDTLHVGMSWNIGFHGDENKNEYMSVDLVDDNEHSCIDFKFCSIQCMRIWLNNLLNDCETLFQEKLGEKP